jgi:5-methylcytosine-specific restriction endonuclease McrA
MNICKWHLCSNETKTIFCSTKCKNKFHVKKKRKDLKLKAVEHKGGKCVRCGYNKSVEALEFHHINPDEKEFSISKTGNTYSWEKIKEEINKCLLLCSNCHREVHAELLISIPE